MKEFRFHSLNGDRCTTVIASTRQEAYELRDAHRRAVKKRMEEAAAGSGRLPVDDEQHEIINVQSPSPLCC